MLKKQYDDVLNYNRNWTKTTRRSSSEKTQPVAHTSTPVA